MANQITFRGDRLREARRTNGWTQQQLAEKLSITRAQVTNLEIGNGEPSMRTLALAAYVLGVTSDWLIDVSDALTAAQVAQPPIPFADE